MRTKSRIPEMFTVVTGAGEGNMAPGTDHYETGSYDAALLDAGLEVANCNIMKYTSVLPPEAIYITVEEARELGLWHHGMVLECIMARQNGFQGDHITAGVGTFHLYHNDELVGGFAAEYEGHLPVEKAKVALAHDLKGIFDRRYWTKEGYDMRDMQLHVRDLTVGEDVGTVFVALAFLSFEVPEIEG